MRKRLSGVTLLIAAVAVLSIVAAGTGGVFKSSGRSATPLPSSACGPVFYKGPGKAQYLIASDLPLQGAGRAQQIAQGKAIQYVLDKQYHFKVGKYRIGYQACDDSTAQAAAWDAAKCTSNGRAYAANTSLLGILGTFNSGCAKLIIPLANRAPGGPLGMLSVANTGVGLTHTAPWTAPGEPGVYYPTGKRNYVRVAASDDYQGPAAVDLLLSKAFKLAQGKKFAPIKDVYILHDNQTFGKGVAEAFKLRIVCNNGAKLLKDLRAVLGSGPVFVGPDGWTPYSATLAAGSAAQNMYVSYAGLPLEKLGPSGKKFIKAFSKYLRLKKGELPPPYAVYQAQGAQIMLEAIKRSNGTRASVTSQLFKTRVVNGIMGTFHFDKNGDIVPTKAISFDQLRGDKGVPVFAVILKVKA